MFKHFFIISTMFAAFFFFTACVGQPTAPVGKGKQASDGSGTLWAENTNIDADENDNVDVSDLDKDVTSSGEAVAAQTVNRIAFPVAEYNALARTGKGTIQGHIYIQDAYGKKIFGTKTRLYLNPVTSYSRQWYEESYVSGQKMGKADSRLFNYLKFTASDNDGGFAFYGVPSGRYYLIGTVVCGNECGYSSSKNIRIATEVFISGNDVVEQDLSRNIQ
ncbi:MAG: carboxypeptidase regulatory-like domain-containing protein [Campylobacterota bacterium]|nr:carboxypeptidase regulatory-like domain-containing protein [Campylobacterota bacterium]